MDTSGATIPTSPGSQRPRRRSWPATPGCGSRLRTRFANRLWLTHPFAKNAKRVGHPILSSRKEREKWGTRRFANKVSPGFRIKINPAPEEKYVDDTDA